MIDTIVDPSLKLSLYHINGASLSATPDLNNIARLHINDNTIPCLKELVDIVNSKDAAFTKAEDKMSIDLLKKIQWSKYSADIRSEDTSRLLMFAQAKTLPHFVNVSSYDPALLAWQEVLEHHSTEMEKTNDLTDEEIEDNQVILAYIKYQLIFLKIRRDLTLIEELSIKQKKNLSKNFVLLKNKDILRILENILRAVQELKDLPGVYNNEEMWKALETIESYYQIIKITKLAESYLTSRKLKESLALLSKANQLCNFLESTDVIDHINIPNLPISKDVETLKLEVERNLNKVHILCNYFESRKTSDDFLINNINKFIGGSADETLNKVVNMENNFEPIHVKPVLFDIAFNYITYDDDTNKNEQREVQRGANEEESNKAKKGFFGLFGGGR
ncbi:hypothetical protein PACTADRAFT_50649 [Pachysolen tannophilus NRRL Y-2460]|uniref:Signal recognition particle subunit SRP68 n=1 Tax=Pachysolen tannophilus NRRL Y-2460 TaxID=669874 RepID=A0A1E4TSR5_PACTA|nr:hypothetical protein PACTADRAFT_50649 [Pachysolen tannophilus NRRL Y-2460]